MRAIVAAAGFSAAGLIRVRETAPQERECVLRISAELVRIAGHVNPTGAQDAQPSPHPVHGGDLSRAAEIDAVLDLGRAAALRRVADDECRQLGVGGRHHGSEFARERSKRQAFRR